MRKRRWSNFIRWGLTGLYSHPAVKTRPAERESPKSAIAAYIDKNSYFYGMTTVQVDILNPKAGKLLEDLAELKLISIRTVPNDGFLKLVNKFRAKAKTNPPSLAEITNEVEIVRAKRYARSKK
jgi:hypothetical protein